MRTLTGALTMTMTGAKAVREYLIGKGVHPDRLEAKGFGEVRPIANNNTLRGRRANRRVALKVIQVNPGAAEETVGGSEDSTNHREEHDEYRSKDCLWESFHEFKRS